MSAQTRWFVADDRDGSITYSGTWSSIDGSQYNGEGNFGETFLNTLHRTTTTGSSMSFTFTGDAARIMGTTAVKNAKTTPDPDWKCYLDGQETKKESAYQYTENNWVFCKFYDLPAGKHTIRIDITTNGQPFLLDQIQYKPTVSTSNTAAYITRYDPDLAYDSSWQGLGDVGRMATVQGSKVTFSFIGNRLTWFGMYPNQLPHGDAPASYTIDGGAAVAFTIRGGGDTSEYNRQILQTPRLSQDRHTLVVIYQGGTNLTPLVLGNLVVDGGTTELLGTASSSGDSGNGSSGGASSITTVVKDGTTTTTAVGSSITVTKISDADSDILPNALQEARRYTRLTLIRNKSQETQVIKLRMAVLAAKIARDLVSLSLRSLASSLEYCCSCSLGVCSCTGNETGGVTAVINTDFRKDALR